MLLKLLFTVLAALWLVQALRPLFGAPNRDGHAKTPAPPPPRDVQKKSTDDTGEYIEYEEIK
ncbi:MAG: hypothetical protein ABMA02_11325 [Saprospiraceae bacterium]